ncbi:hypothetical protein [Legionella impletisoli]|uniref:Uncharacterized protein n=1 Tax=Legionella impletisoli TaxID=343510 RepID=A0A917NBT9_9GAMM|nr:hypothetical protein [Legionella impletisoli]GGI85410.1 hypothetical protein GCM10007966_12550 [Legionella impletisoli]
MTTLKRDILITLTIKFFLLTILWFVCIKPLRHKPIETHDWMLKYTVQNKRYLNQGNS